MEFNGGGIETLQKSPTDYPAPINVRLNDLNRGGIDEVSYEVTWWIRSKVNLTEYRVKVCTPWCAETKVSTHQLSTTIRVPYYTSFQVSVIAVFRGWDPIRVIKRSSSGVLSKSRVGPPSAVKNLKGFLENNGKSLKIWWDRPSPPNGPVDYYDVTVTDSIDSSKTVWYV